MTDRRSLSGKLRAKILLRHDGRCAICGKRLSAGQWEVDHIAALVHGGKNEEDNYRALCVPCHRGKSKSDVQAKAKVERIRIGGKTRKSRPLPGSRASGIRKRFNGTVERW